MRWYSMIVREHEREFTMIEQHHHADTSFQIMGNWREDLFKKNALRKSVEYAIAKHDCGWQPFDIEPFWNEKDQAPYTFMNFPEPAKIVLYKKGIDEVEASDPYAAALCSEHYSRFLVNNKDHASRKFIQHEKERRERIFSSISSFDQDAFDFHYALLQLGDNLSLYLCLNEPEPTAESIHPFFKKGVAVSEPLKSFLDGTIQPNWKRENHIHLDPFPFKKPFTVTLKQKTVKKTAISEQGLIDSYISTPYEELTYHFDEK
ncbi:DUF3891 family protein [Virgibacillus halodenitrificans]|nr:DUF3891 family protein [Virgibacillus halodenitrificans]